MDKIIKEGTLRLQTTESTCDVILSCKGHRLLAHKLILSIASPVLRVGKNCYLFIKYMTRFNHEKILIQFCYIV